MTLKEIEPLPLPTLRGCNVLNDALQVAPKAQDLYKILLSSGKDIGPRPKERLELGYYQPNLYYEYLVARLISTGSRWIDVGGGAKLFSSNRKLSEELSERAEKLVVVDPSDNVHANPFACERFQGILEDYRTDQAFDIATMRMVVEHVQEPKAFANRLRELLLPGGLAVLFTVHLWSAVTVISRITPDALHHAVKKRIWGGHEKDTFPTAYKMNTRRGLRQVFDDSGFDEVFYAQIDDLSVFSHFQKMRRAELTFWHWWSKLGISYPEANVLAVYRKRAGNGFGSHVA